MNGEQRERLRERLRGLGFDVVRFASAGVAPGRGMLEWLAAGNQADMAGLERTADKRLDPQLVLPGVQGVGLAVLGILLAIWYDRRVKARGGLSFTIVRVF